MPRVTGMYRTATVGGEQIRAFLPHSLPPADPPLELSGSLTSLLSEGTAALGRLMIAGQMVPSADCFLYGFVRKEAVITSQIEGTQATLQDVLSFEVTRQTDRPDDVQEVCNYVDPLSYARRELARPKGLPLSSHCGNS